MIESYLSDKEFTTREGLYSLYKSLKKCSYERRD